MLVALLSAALASADERDSSAGAGEVAPGATSTEGTPAPATPPLTTDGSSTPTATAVPAPATAPAAVEAAPAAPTQPTVGQPTVGQPTVGQHRAYRTGRMLANAGIVALPAGAVTDDIFRPTAAEDAAFDAGLLAAAFALPLVWSGVALERSAIRRAGCKAGGDGWRYAPRVPLAIGAIRAVDDSEEIALGIGGAWAVLGVQHVVLQPSAKRCGPRGLRQP